MCPFQSRLTSYKVFSNMLSSLGLNSLEIGIYLSVSGSTLVEDISLLKCVFLQKE